MIYCQKCNTIMWRAPIVLTSDPVQYQYHCPKCGNTKYLFVCDNDRIIENRQQWEQIQKDAQGEKTRMTKIERHKELCEYLNTLYTQKNHDYGDSFHLTYLEEGMAMPRIRLSDKFNRFKTLSKTNQLVNDESIKDTLLDLANYAIMTVLEIEQAEGKFD